MSNCKNCGNEIKWKEPYTKGDGPLNLDGSSHFCKKHESFKPIPMTSLEITMPKGSEIDIKVLERIRSESYVTAQQNIAKYIGVRKACMESGMDNPAMIGMIYNSVVRNE
jgi:hypothetical protein